VHIAAVLYYLYAKKQNLIRPMIHGDKLVSAATPASRDSLQTRLIAFVVVISCAYVVYLLVSLSAAA